MAGRAGGHEGIAGELAGYEPALGVPLYERVLDWVNRLLVGAGFGRPFRKRLATLVAGLVAGEGARVGQVAEAVHGLAVTPAKEESVARRLLRLLGDPRLDPERLLPALLGALLPTLLRELGAPGAADRLLMVVDETSKADGAHILVVGLAYRGVVLPLAVRCWAQNEPLPEGAYWDALGGALWAVRALLPPAWRSRALLVADRAYGVPRMVDLLDALGWDWVLRAQGQARVRLPDGGVRELRSLAPRPGAAWSGGFAAAGALDGPPPGAGGAPPLAVFKKAGWRACRVVAAWAEGADEPWLLLTSLPPTRARLVEYAARWMVERLFLAWKSHGWDLESCGVVGPERLGRLLSGLAIATFWRVAMALPAAHDHLTDLKARAARRAASPAPVQLPLPWADTPPAPPAAPSRPWAAKFSLLSHGAKVARACALAARTPALRWAFPDWHAPTWSIHCHQAYASPA
jgi:hypothetical protein